jgi:hypothetical protein
MIKITETTPQTLTVKIEGSWDGNRFFEIDLVDLKHRQEEAQEKEKTMKREFKVGDKAKVVRVDGNIPDRLLGKTIKIDKVEGYKDYYKEYYDDYGWCYTPDNLELVEPATKPQKLEQPDHNKTYLYKGEEFHVLAAKLHTKHMGGSVWRISMVCRNTGTAWDDLTLEEFNEMFVRGEDETPEPPFTRTEIFALIDAYPETHKVVLKKEDAKRLGFVLNDFGECYYAAIKITVWCATENQPDITLNGSGDIQLATWTKGEPLPYRADSETASKLRTHPNMQRRFRDEDDGFGEPLEDAELLNNWGKLLGVERKHATEPNTEYRKRMGDAVKSSSAQCGQTNLQFDGVADFLTGQLAEPFTEPEPETQTTHTFSAELPDGCVVEMPSPGDDWVEIEREEFKRGDCWARYEDDDIFYAETLQEMERMNFVTDMQRCWYDEFEPKLYEHAPILSITTWERTVQPKFDIEDLAYTWDTEFGRPKCPSNTNYIGLEIWPERGSEVE